MEYPKALFKDGTEIDVNGVTVDSITVENEDDEIAARDLGWGDFVDCAKDDEPSDDKPRRGRPPKPASDAASSA